MSRGATVLTSVTWTKVSWLKCSRLAVCECVCVIMAPVSDPCSFSSFSKCVTRHVNVFYRVDFDSHVLKGKVALTVEVLQDKFSDLVKKIYIYLYISRDYINDFSPCM